MIKLATALLALCATVASARGQTVASAPSGTISLTAEEREAALEAGAARAMDDSLQNGGTGRRVHGEVGVEVGSRGERAAYGTVVAPIGRNGVAAFSYGTGQSPRWHHRGRFRRTWVGGAISNDVALAAAPVAGEAENVNPD
jgi:hypothetical protein